MKSKMIFISLLGLGILTTNSGCGGDVAGPCSIWRAHATDSVSVAPGSQVEVDLLPDYDSGNTLSGAHLSNSASAVGITITQLAGNTFLIHASPTSPSGVYTFDLTASSYYAGPCADSEPEPIVVTVQ